jgi:SET domain-containing protein
MNDRAATGSLRHMIHPDTALRFISPEKGYGVVATRLIPKGTITWAFDAFDQIFTIREFSALDFRYRTILNTYSYRDHNGAYILCWDNARFLNHSFHSSCITTAYDFELAVRDIHPGEELTDDYGYLNVDKPWDCAPEPDTPRTRVLPDDLLHFHEEWDARLREAFGLYKEVDQPLSWLIGEKYRNKVLAVAAGTAEMDSILNCYFDRTKA